MTKIRQFLDRRLFARLSKRCAAAQDEVAQLELGDLQQLRHQVLGARQNLGAILSKIEPRLQQALYGGGRAMPLAGTDWRWRPEIWQGRVFEINQIAPASGHRLGAGVSLFHDSGDYGLNMRQHAPYGLSGGAPYALSLEAYEFDGSYASLVVDFPPEAITGLKLRHILRFDMMCAAERASHLQIRLNIRHGPNHEQITQNFDLPEGPQTCVWDFDLAYLELNEKRVEAIWLDMIFQPIAMNRITIADLVLSRRPRAAL